jgi:CubicO group peptidase (beta-lactamase class C family)
LAAALVQRDGRELRAADGLACLETGAPADVDTVFAWYSLTKVLTATACVRECLRAGVELDARVVDVDPTLIPEQRATQATRWAAVTIRQLLSHAAGVGDRQLHAAGWFLGPGEDWPDPRATLQGVLARRDWLTRPPGTGFHYSNLGYAVLGEVLATLSGAPFRELVVQRVLRPVGAARATFDPPSARGPEYVAARGLVRRWSRMGLLAEALGRFGGASFTDGRVPSEPGLPGTWVGVRQRRPVFSPHGGLWGPVGDLVPVLREHLDASLDPRHVLHDMQRVHRSRSGRARHRGEGGLGWRVHAGPPRRLSHGGLGPGFTAEMVLLPEQGRAAAVVGNATFDAKAVVAELLSG